MAAPPRRDASAARRPSGCPSGRRLVAAPRRHRARARLRRGLRSPAREEGRRHADACLGGRLPIVTSAPCSATSQSNGWHCSATASAGHSPPRAKRSSMGGTWRCMNLRDQRPVARPWLSRWRSRSSCCSSRSRCCWRSPGSKPAASMTAAATRIGAPASRASATASPGRASTWRRRPSRSRVMSPYSAWPTSRRMVTCSTRASSAAIRRGAGRGWSASAAAAVCGSARPSRRWRRRLVPAPAAAGRPVPAA
jgi:hypothetical protein